MILSFVALTCRFVIVDDEILKAWHFNIHLCMRGYHVPFLTFAFLKVNLQTLLLLHFLLLAANFPCLIHVSRFLFRWVWKETVLDMFHKTALSLVKARREEGNSQMVSQVGG